MNNLQLELGGPGCGKTSRLLTLTEQELAAGVRPTEIAFVTFTKAGATEAQERAAKKFSYTREDLPWFRTIHSLAYQRLGVTREEVMGREDWARFSEVIGFPISGSYDSDTPTPTGTLGDKMLRIVDYAATTMMSLEDAWHELNEAVSWHRLKQFDAALRQFKEDTGKLDFGDMLRDYARDGKPLPIKVAIIDEAQDLTAAQWAVAERAFAGAERVYVAGDDDQAIYKWAGADVDTFLKLSQHPNVLRMSHRLPKPVFDIGQEIAARISRRYAKPYVHNPDAEGSVEYEMALDSIDLLREGSWLLLARNRYMLLELEKYARQFGVNYVLKGTAAIRPDDIEVMFLWERLNSRKQTELTAPEVRTICKALDRPKPALRELARYKVEDFPEWPIGVIWHRALVGITAERRDYYVSCMKRGEKLRSAPRIRIETIHGVKGAEADNVVLMTDMSERSWQGLQTAPDHEHRVFYVGATRARRTLHVVRPQGSRGYPLVS